MCKFYHKKQRLPKKALQSYTFFAKVCNFYLKKFVNYYYSLL